jgi:hypothetical protein
MPREGIASPQVLGHLRHPVELNSPPHIIPPMKGDVKRYVTSFPKALRPFDVTGESKEDMVFIM